MSNYLRSIVGIVLICVLVQHVSGCAVIGRRDYFTAAQDSGRGISNVCDEYIGYPIGGLEAKLQGPPQVTELDFSGGVAGICSESLDHGGVTAVLAGPFIPIIPIPISGNGYRYFHIQLKVKSSTDRMRIIMQDAYIETVNGKLLRPTACIPEQVLGSGVRVMYRRCKIDEEHLISGNSEVDLNLGGVITYWFENLPEEDLREIYFFPALVGESGVIYQIKFHLKRVK